MGIGKPKYEYVEISNTNITPYLRGVSMTNNYQNVIVKSAKIILTKKADKFLDFSEELNGKRVIIKRGTDDNYNEWVLKGEVVNIKPKGNQYDVYVSDRLYETQKEIVSTTFDKDIDPEQGVISEIVKTLINENSQLTADDTSIQNSGTGTILKKFSCNAAQLFERLETIAKKINWQLYYSEEDDKVHFEEKGFTEFPTKLNVGTNIVSVPQWDEDAEDLYNEVEVRGATQTVETTETGQIGTDEGYTTSEISLSYKPISTRVYADSSNPPTTLRSGGVERSSANYDYSVDVDRRKIIWNTTNYSPSTGDYVKIDYSYPIPTPSSMKDEQSIIQYSPDEDNPQSKKKIEHQLDITTVDDAETYGWNTLDLHKDPVIQATINVTNVTGLKVGQLVNVTDTINGISGQFGIIKCKKIFPYRYDTITVVNKVIDDNNTSYALNKRIKRLEEQSLGEEEIIQNVAFETAPYPFEGRDFIIEKRDVSPDYIWGNTNWTWSDTQYSWQSTYTNDKTIFRKTQYNNVYKEFVYDEDYYDATNSTGVTWDTSNKEITITGTLMSNLITKGFSYSAVIPRLNNFSGSPKIEISNNNKVNWQELTLNTKNTLTNSDGEGTYIRITPDPDEETFGSNGLFFPIQLAEIGTLKLLNTYKNTGALDKPAIELVFS